MVFVIKMQRYEEYPNWQNKTRKEFLQIQKKFVLLQILAFTSGLGWKRKQVDKIVDMLKEIKEPVADW